MFELNRKKGTATKLRARFPEVHPEAELDITFQRTLRIPDDGKDYPLPAGLGRLPLRYIEDCEGELSQDTLNRGGILMPMYQSEATWIDFSCDYPMAIKIAAGKINAVTGEPWSNGLHANPQDYMVAPEQPWLDGFCVEEGIVRQFVAEPLGQGKTVEEVMTGEAEWGGLQIIVYPMKAEEYRRRFDWPEEQLYDMPMMSRQAVDSMSEPMGLAAGGRIHQEIYEDDYGVHVWDWDAASRCFVHIANSTTYERMTGQPPPSTPITQQEYHKQGIPWFMHYAENAKALGGGQFDRLKDVRHVSSGLW
ncbi:MAG: hypothetical protein O3C15_09325 [Proteobacteria bacterium]|nr:hypothetical protein [Pseudomonadota bacterium]